MSRLYLSNPCAFLFYPLHTVLRAQSAPGLPCALSFQEGGMTIQTSGETRREIARVCLR